jgi:hypothetical protein
MALAERDRRALIIFGAVLVVALAAYFLLGKKGEGAPAAAESPSVTSPFSPAPSTSPTGSPHVTPRTPPPSGLPLAGKDPFSPLVNPSSSGGGGPSTTGPTGTSGPTGTTGPTGTSNPTSPTPTGTGTSSPTPTGPTPTVSPPASPSTAPGAHIGGHTVTLLDIFTRDGVAKAQVQVDSTVYTVSVGDTFSDGFKLLSITGSCATFTHAGQQFVLCENPQK